MDNLDVCTSPQPTLPPIFPLLHLLVHARLFRLRVANKTLKVAASGDYAHPHPPEIRPRLLEIP